MCYGRELAQDIVRYMADYDVDTLTSREECSGALAIMEAYDETMAQLQGDGWVHVAWYLVTCICPDRDDIARTEAFDLLERLFSDHGIG